MKLMKGDLVGCYLMDSSDMVERLLEHGIVLDVNIATKDVFVLNNLGESRWWPQKRWRLLKRGSDIGPGSSDG